MCDDTRLSVPLGPRQDGRVFEPQQVRALIVTGPANSLDPITPAMYRNNLVGQIFFRRLWNETIDYPATVGGIVPKRSAAVSLISGSCWDLLG